jgi:hypothetical protein
VQVSIHAIKKKTAKRSASLNASHNCQNLTEQDRMKESTYSPEQHGNPPFDICTDMTPARQSTLNFFFVLLHEAEPPTVSYQT